MHLGTLLLNGYTLEVAYKESLEGGGIVQSKDVYAEWLAELAAIAGGLAGIYYGYHAIPDMWIQELKNKQMILSICRKWNKK